MILKTLPEYFQVLVERSSHREKLQAYSQGFPDNLIGFMDTTTNEIFAVRLGTIKAYYQIRTFDPPIAGTMLFARDSRLAYEGKMPDPMAPPTKWVKEEHPLPTGNTAVVLTRSQ